MVPDTRGCTLHGTLGMHACGLCQVGVMCPLPPLPTRMLRSPRASRPCDAAMRGHFDDQIHSFSCRRWTLLVAYQRHHYYYCMLVHVDLGSGDWGGLPVLRRNCGDF